MQSLWPVSFQKLTVLCELKFTFTADLTCVVLVVILEKLCHLFHVDSDNVHLNSTSDQRGVCIYK